ncbi:MAG TPA: hypothetical protein VEH82_04820 [Acidimicrobiales bacterium]|nr:hypothetical protein [Acidimicrobiales bacterium]
MQHAPAQLVGRRVDELDLVGLPHHPVRHPLAHADPGDPLDGVGQRLEVLDVDRRDDGDAGVEDLEDVFPALLVTARPRDVGVGQLVDQHHLRLAVEHAVEVHLLPRRAAVLDPLARDHREIADLLERVGPLVRLHEAHHHVRPPLEASPSLVEHGACLADAGRRAEVDTEAPGRPDPFVLARGAHLHLACIGSVTTSVHSIAGATSADEKP